LLLQCNLQCMKKKIFILSFSTLTIACADKKSDNNSENTNLETEEVTADPNDILGKEWQLIELDGVEVTLDNSLTKYPYIKFNDLKTASGNLGCNSFGSIVEFTGSNSIKFSEIVSTEMACSNLETEEKFNKALQSATTYIVSGTKLFLNNDQNLTVATMEKIIKP